MDVSCLTTASRDCCCCEMDDSGAPLVSRPENVRLAGAGEPSPPAEDELAKDGGSAIGGAVMPEAAAVADG